MKRKLPLILLCILFFGVAAFFGIQMLIQWQEYQAGRQMYQDLAQYVSPPPETPEKAPENLSASPNAAEQDDTQWPLVDFEALQRTGKDVVAWIYIEGTAINYPVVQSSNNSYYLNRLADGTVNSAGSIFMDYRNDPHLTDRNTILYGHHMKNGTMFQPITRYKNQSFYEDHPVCLILTPQGNYKVEIFAGYVTNMNTQAWKLEFGSDEEYESWLQEAVSQSLFRSPIVPTAQDRVVTFSTCTYEYSDARFVLVGVIRS